MINPVRRSGWSQKLREARGKADSSETFFPNPCDFIAWLRRPVTIHSTGQCHVTELYQSSHSKSTTEPLSSGAIPDFFWDGLSFYTAAHGLVPAIFDPLRTLKPFPPTLLSNSGPTRLPQGPLIFRQASGRPAPDPGEWSQQSGKHAHASGKDSQALGMLTQPLGMFAQGLGQFAQTLSGPSQALGDLARDSGKLARVLGDLPRASSPLCQPLSHPDRPALQESGWAIRPARLRNRSTFSRKLFHGFNFCDKLDLIGNVT